MTPEKWDRLKPLFERALEMAPEDRSAFVEKILVDHKERGPTSRH
jgi:hypothetical protein